MRVVCLSDLHGRLPSVDEIPECDLLLLAGDIAPDYYGQSGTFGDPAMQMRWWTTDYAKWERLVRAERIAGTLGNHDWITDLPDTFKTTIHIDELVEIEGRTFYFTPWTPRVSGMREWNYMYREHAFAEEVFSKIPLKVDMLVSHGPPYQVLDETHDYVHAGSIELRTAVGAKRPKHMIFGHIHEGRRHKDIHQLGLTTCYNVAMYGFNWQPTQLSL